MQQRPRLSSHDFTCGSASIELGNGTLLETLRGRAQTRGTQDFFNGRRFSDVLLYAAPLEAAERHGVAKKAVRSL